MNFDDFQEACKQFAIYPKDREREYLSLGLLSEVGELAGKVKKEIRDGVDLTEDILQECGDICWYCGMLCRHFKWKCGFAGSSFTDRISTDFGLIQEMIPAETLHHPWQMNRILDCLLAFVVRRGTTIEAVMDRNIAKLADRSIRGKLGGSGDAR